MALDSESIWEALAARLEGLDGFSGSVRRKRLPVPGLEELPALFVVDDSGDEDLISDPDDPAPMWRLSGEIMIVARAEKEADRPASILNALVKTVREALERTNAEAPGGGWSYYTDLGGRIRVLSISKVEKGAGEVTGQAIAKVHVEIETNPA